MPYTQTLIPEKADFVPAPTQVGGFLAGLCQLGAAPKDFELDIFKPSPKKIKRKDPISGQTRTYQVGQSVACADVDHVAAAIKGLQEYSVNLSGSGPPKLRSLTIPFKDFKGKYEFIVSCRLKPELIAMSDWHDEGGGEYRVTPFGEPCGPRERLGIFNNPQTLEVIKVPNAGCCRFWVEIEFGKFLYPEITDSLNILDPKIANLAADQFGISFVQGCYWGDD
jgi:hypothetical protein